ncbi:MAG: hypothetical protein J5922_00830 [Clostridia bacterium]|nr:hypothetical protein [Clostridia bacterium]
MPLPSANFTKIAGVRRSPVPKTGYSSGRVAVWRAQGTQVFSTQYATL